MCLLRAVCALVAVLLLVAPAAGQVPPVVIEADQIVYDTVGRRIEAAGNVRIRHRDVRLWADYALVDLERQEILLRGNVVLVYRDGRLVAQALRYDLRTQSASATDVRAVQDQVYFRAREVRLQEGVLRALDGFVTICDPAAPLYSVVAERVTVVPGRAVVAENAALRVGNTTVLRVPRFELPLLELPLDEVRPEDVARNFPRPEGGHDVVSGFWGALRYPYRVGDVAGEAYLRYNTILGFEGYNRLRYARPTWSMDLVVGVLRDAGNRMYEAVELRYETAPWSGTVHLSFGVSAGYYRERTTGAEGPRVQGTARMGTPPLDLGAGLSLALSGSVRYSIYADRTLLAPTAGATLTYRLDPNSTLALSYRWSEFYGSTPFLFDAPSRESLVTASYAHAARGFAFGAGVQYDFVPRHFRLLGNVHVTTADEWRFGVAARYNVTTSAFEDLDLSVGKRCDCLDVGLTYRVVQRQFWITVNLVPSPRIQQLIPHPPP